MRFHARFFARFAALSGMLLLGPTISSCAPPATRGVTRTYYIAADPVDWDYAPTDSDLTMGMGQPLPASAFAMHNAKGQAKIFRKAVYRAYTDSTFTHLNPRPATWRHLGMLGPVLRGAVGDTIVVVFKNNTDFAASVHPHGVFYDKKSEGALYYDGTGAAGHLDDSVPPGQIYRYVWPIPARAGPGPNDPSSILWVYHSHTDEPADVNAGLIGPIIITRRGMARPDGSPKDVDREFVTMFASVREGLSHYYRQNLKRYTGDTTGVSPKGPILFNENSGNLFDTINGLMYGNLPVSSLTMKRGERVRWYVFSFTNLIDQHSPHWHGNTVLVDGNRKDVLDLDGPLLMNTADMIPDNLGTWLYHCHVALHVKFGMSARYRVIPRDSIVPADTAHARTVDPMTGIVKDFAD